KYFAAYKSEAEKLFRLICFNYVFSNGDAHLKNFSLSQTIHGDYLLSPAYDLLCTSMHLPNESRLALELFDDFESDHFKTNGFYGRPDFMELSRRFGLPEKRSEAILDRFLAQQIAVRGMIDRSFLSPRAKTDYSDRFTDRLQ